MARDVLVMDEAGMVGSQQMERVLSATRERGAKVVRVGNPEQLQVIEAGAAFRALAERHGAAEVGAVRRQREAWQRSATRELATARTGAALGRYEVAGIVRGHATQDEARVAVTQPSRNELAKSGMLAKLERCGSQLRPCIRVDESAEARIIGICTLPTCPWVVYIILINYCVAMSHQNSSTTQAMDKRLKGAPTRTLQMLLVISFTAAVAWAMLAIVLTFVGYVESDDLAYAMSASGWLTSAPYLGTNHWAIRHCIVLPMALGFKLFGESEATLVLPSLCYAALLLILLGTIAARLGGWKAAVLTIAMAGSIPVFATGASLVSTDLPEAFFIIGSVWAWHCGREDGRPALLLVSGLAAGCAIITRETTAALLLFYLVAFLADRERGVQNYLIMAVGFVLAFGADWLYLYIMSGDPIYRVHIAMNGAQGDGPQLETSGEAASGVDRFGAIALPRALRPFGAVFLNQNFGLLFWIAVPATVWLAIHERGEVKRSAMVFLGLFGTWLVVSGYILAPWLWVIPRYYAVCIVLIVPLAVLLSSFLSRKRLWAAAAIVLLLGSNLALDLGSTSGIMAGERALFAAVQAYPGVMHTDPSTARGASWLLARQGLEKRISTSLPVAGDFYFFDSRPRRAVPINWALRSVPTEWVPLEAKTHSTKWTGPLVRTLGLEALLPAGLLAKLDPVPLTTAIYRVPAAPAGN